MEKTTLLAKRACLFLVLVFLPFIGSAQTSITFPSTTTWTCPAGVTQISIEAWGGGGAGGGATGNPSAGGGGAGGAYVKNATLSVTPGSSYNITVGGTKTGTTGGAQNGNPSSFALTATPAVLLINAVGGNGGLASSSNNTSAAGGAAVATGNIGGTTSNIYGSAGLTGTGLGGSKGGNGGASGGGAAGGLGTTTITPNNGNLYGGGGSGGKSTDSNDRAGGNGAAGQIIISYDSPEINIQGNSVSIVDGDASPTTADYTDFGSTYIGSANTVTYTIQNTGNTTLTIGAISFSGGNASDFTVIGLPSSTVAVGSFTTFTVRFFPSTAGVKNTSLSIINNDANENPYNFTIQGTGINLGVAQEIQIEGNATIIPDNGVVTTTNNWTILGDTFVSTLITKTYTIKNMGTTTLTIGAISFSGTNATEFTVTTAPSASVSGGSSTTFVVRFLPTAAGIRTATISIVNNDATENPYNFAIQGNSFTSVPTPEIDLQGNSISIGNGDITPSINDWTDFGSTQILTNPQIKIFSIRNYGGSNLILSGTPLVSISGSTDFVLTTSPATPIVSLGGTTFSIEFNPSSLGTKTATITIANNDPNEAPYTFSIQGTGIQTFFDSDGDGVYDNVDIDDDNDGIRDITEEVNCSNSNSTKVDYKFLYETFGTGGRTTINTTYAATTTYGYQDATTATDVEGSGLSLDLNDGKYTVGSETQTISNWAPQFWYKGVDHTGDVGGRMAIFNASYTPGIFYTALISGALPNIPITYSFWVLNIDRTDAPSIGTRLRPNIRVEFRDVNDNVLQTISTGAIAPTTNGNLAGDWYQFTSNLTFAVSTFKVIFINNETGGLGNDLALDDILITQKLCDLDTDGIADMFDLDADNDGIEDVIEAGLGDISNGRGKIDVAWSDANINGLHDSAEPAGALPALDSDGDGIPNYIDLDSDNDSLFDVDESGAGNTNAVVGFVNGDGDITGDGRGDGPESENFRSKDTNGDTIVEGFGDGILDAYDYGIGVTFSSQYGNLDQGIATANPATTYLKDTDNDGVPDYLDVRSNGSSFDIANTLLIYDYKILDTNNDGIIDGLTDADKDGIIDIFDTSVSPAYFGSPRDLHTKLFLDFDGRNDYGQSTAILGGLSNASLMAWIDLNPAFSTTGVIVGQDKFQIRIRSDKKLEAVMNGITLTYNTALNVSQWYNVGATYDGSNLKLYLNGNLVATQAASGAIAADASLLSLGKNPVANTNYFKGKIDEVRVFNSALTATQLQRMVYQEIKDFGSEIRGEIVPKNIATSPTTLPFANVLRYYRMDTYKDDIIDDLTTASIDLTGTKIYNHKNIYVQQAPMPFLTERTGNFATAVHSTAKDIRGLDLIENNYSIVKVKHDITETSNSTDLGMFVDPGINVIMNNDTKIQNDWYLKLDGKIDLVGKSQLVQTTESDLDISSSGFIERDQQGQSNLYNYNYWSSPVSPINTLANNTNYSIDGVLRDGTNPSAPTNINWIGGYNGAPTSPISLATFWLYKFDNYGNDYFSWVAITPTDPVRVGQAFTMKGSGAATNQNYVFTGKPNNGLVNSNVVSSDQLMLTGNPYPSSLDAHAFINDNIATNTFDGTLYFWEHYPTNLTHDLRDYQGGYAERNLVGGLPPVATTLISGLGSSIRIPEQFIPVGQGFFVNGILGGGGAITFKNSQRGFHKEDDSGVSNPLFKTKANTKTKIAGINDNDPIAKDTLMRIRLGFNSNNNYHRQVLMGFMNEKATSAIDYGYDAINIDEFPDDMYFLNGDKQLVIQGEGFFDANASYPIGVKTAVEGKASFIVDALENFNAQQAVYIYDNLTNTYNDIRNGKFEIVLPAGEIHNRFSLRFKDQTLKVDQNSISETIQINHIQNGNILEIKNPSLDSKVEKVTLYSILGQSISSWKIENQEQQNIKIPIKSVRSGIYIAKMKTLDGEVSKKVIVFDD